MYILAVETSTEFASVCCLKDDTVLSEMKEIGNRAHNELLFDMIENVINSAGLTLSMIDLFAVGTGPGSFTGLRVGASAVKGMAMGLSKKIIPVYSIDAAALKAFGVCPEEERLSLVLEGRQKDFFHAEYSFSNGNLEKISEIIVHPYEKSSYIEGCAAGNVMKENVSFKKYRDGVYPEASFVGRLGFAKRDSAGFDYSFEPEYYKDFKVR
ncbi:MAG: tRNA (adenosine(37)-N6)-threonylcarbamoyltransferase complex dimerization subunit type 1 TsaB [Candidatus Delongbacteria bacterium]|nr:tRNA (adenosine(37)-N6)-threonylcarbamoyltransferase complex dimerization subunit type 1 TsaB [Candidatus Delongbacteria bacterium]